MEGEPVSLVVEAFEWDEENIAHLHHSVTVGEIEEARANNPIYLPNRPGRTASHVMVGESNDGIHVYVPIVEVRPTLWRPVTGWRSRKAYQIWTTYRGRK